MFFVVPGEPQGKGRPRFTKSGHAYTPQKTKEYEALVQESFKKAYGGMHDGAIRMSIVCYFGIPKSKSKAEKEKMLSGEILPTKRPDADNCCKVILDSLNGLCYRDDSQVVELIIRKRYDTEPRVEVAIQEI